MNRSQALLNATKKQYGAHAHLIPWSLSTPSATSPFIPPLPRLPPPPSATIDTPARHQLDDLPEVVGRDGVHMADEDLQSTSRFVREFATQSLIPWMERNVIEWNEAVSDRVFILSVEVNLIQVCGHTPFAFSSVLDHSSILRHLRTINPCAL
jgi:hypothetical protein